MNNLDSTAYTSTNQLLITSVRYDGDNISFWNAKVAHNFLLYLVIIKNSNFILLHDFVFGIEKQDFYVKSLNCLFFHSVLTTVF
jgi:hypothetical protein